MRKISYYLVLIVLVGVSVSVFWGYDRYFKVDDKKPISFLVERGSIKEVVRVRGEVVSEKDFDLEFPFSGTVKQIFVTEGSTMKTGSPIIKLDTTDFELEIKQFESELLQNKANLDKLIAGATDEDIKVSEVKVKNAEIAVVDAKKNLINKLQDAYLKADNAIRNKSDQLFDNPKGTNPKINFAINNMQLQSDIESRRSVLEQILTSWKPLMESISIDDDLNTSINGADKNLKNIREFLDRLGIAVNDLTSNSSITTNVIDGYKEDVSTARTDINAAIVNISNADENLRVKISSMELAKLELELKISGAREEDIAIANARIEETQSKISIVKEKIQKSTLYAPGAVIVEKIWLEEGEVARLGSVVVSLTSLGFKIQADVSELEIGKIHVADGNDVIVELDAFQNKLLSGKVVSIEPRKVVRDGDTYYKINIYFDGDKRGIRAGMSADLTILVSELSDVLIIPEIAVRKVGEKYFVTVMEDGVTSEREVIVGVSDNENIEIQSGLSIGETVILQ